MIKIINKIIDKMVRICKPQRKFIIKIIECILAAHGKMNFRNLSRYGEISEKTVSRNYQKEFNFAEFNTLLLQEQILPNDHLICAFDPSFVKKSGKKTEGSAMFWNGSAGRAEKGLEVGLLSVINVKTKEAYAISAAQTVDKKEDDLATDDKAENNETRIDLYVDHIEEASKHLPETIKHLVVDAFFFKSKFVHGIKQNTKFDIIGKMRSDANLRYPFKGSQSGKGRPKKFDGKFDLDDLSKLTDEGIIKINDNKDEVQLHSGILYSMSLEMDVKIVTLTMKTNSGLMKAILYSTDQNLGSKDIYLLYATRFQIEFQFRDAKQFTGLADCQARSTDKLNFHFNLSFMALNLARFTYQTDQPFSMASIKSIHYNKALIECLFSNSDIDLSLIKSSPGYNNALYYGAIHV
ncbi:MAG TPA: transposase [Candidatus Babeliales bacterium]|nr:transposase [Candidatus Babeliales bacterium]